MTNQELLTKFNQWADGLISDYEDARQRHTVNEYRAFLKGAIDILVAAKSYLAKLVKEAMRWEEEEKRADKEEIEGKFKEFGNVKELLDELHEIEPVEKEEGINARRSNP